MNLVIRILLIHTSEYEYVSDRACATFAYWGRGDELLFRLCNRAALYNASHIQVMHWSQSLRMVLEMNPTLICCHVPFIFDSICIFNILWVCKLLQLLNYCEWSRKHLNCVCFNRSDSNVETDSEIEFSSAQKLFSVQNSIYSGIPLLS